MNTTSQPMIHIVDVAEKLGLPVWRVRALIDAGAMSAATIDGRTYIRRGEIVKALMVIEAGRAHDEVIRAVAS